MIAAGVLNFKCLLESNSADALPCPAAPECRRLPCAGAGHVSAAGSAGVGGLENSRQRRGSNRAGSRRAARGAERESRIADESRLGDEASDYLRCARGPGARLPL